MDTRENFLWAALASVGDAVITTDANGKIAFINGAAESLTGWTLAEAAGQPLNSVFRIVNETTRNDVENPAARAFREGGVVGLANHTVLVAKDGAERPIEDSAAPIRDERGETVGSVLVFRDITARRKAELALERRERELADFFENANVALHLVGADGIIQRANQAALDLLGYKAEEYVGQHVARFHADRPSLDDILSRLLRGESVSKTPVRMRRKDGSIRDVLVNSSGMWEDGQFVHSRCFMLDVTDRKRADQARGLLAAIVSASDDAIVSKTLEGKILSWNAGAERLFGYTAAEAIGQSINLIIPPELRDEERSILERLRQGQRIDHFETVRVAKDNRRIDISLTISPLKDEKGRIVGASKVARDVTERRRIEQARREGETQFRLMADAAPVLIWVSDSQKKGIFFNKGWLDFTGRSLEQELGDGWMEGIHPEDVQRTAGACLRAFQSAEPFRLEFRMRRADGAYRWMLDHAVPQFTQTGALAGYIGSCIDLTDKHEAEKALLENQQRLRLAFEAGGMGAWEWSIATNKVIWSQTLEAIHGLEPGTFPGTYDAYWNDVHPDDRHRVQESIRRTLETGKDHHIVYRIKWPDDSVHFLEARGKLVKDEAGQPVLMIGVCADITARKQADEKLRESEERFRTLADSSPVLIWINGPEGFEFVNRACLDYAGITPSAVRGFDWAQLIHPEDRDGCVNAYQVALAERDTFIAQFRFRRFDGEYRWMKAVGLPRFSGSGDFQGYVGSALDITDIKEAEERLREDDRRKDEFIAILAHELRNPLAALSIGLEVMKGLEAEPTRLREVRGMMERQSSQIIAMVDDLLEVSRITRGKLELQKTRVSLADIVESAIETVKPAIDEGGHHLSVEVPDEKLETEGDPHRLAQILSNLLNNAAKYTPTGGHIALALQRSGEQALLSVKDSGVGIPASMQERIFEMFGQIEQPLDRGKPGLGVGLTLAKTLSEMHGGSIEVHSKGEGQGSEFRVRLPLAPEAASETAPAGEEANTPNTIRRRVLIVDDNVDAAQMLRMLIENLGSQVRTAADGSQAIRIAADFLPDIVFMDLGMPRMNGYEAAEYIRRQIWGKDMMLVALTGWGQEEHRQRIRETGFDHHLVKPANFNRVRELLANLGERTLG